MKHFRTLGFLLIAYANLNAQTITVNTTGKSIQKTIDDAKNGAVIHLSSGKHKPSGPILIENRHNLTIEASDDAVIIGNEANYTKSWEGLIHIKNSDNITLSNIKIKKSNFTGFFVESSHDITIEDSSTNQTFSSGIGVRNSYDVFLHSNTVIDACNAKNGGEESISIANSKYVEVINNDVSNTFDKNNNAGRVLTKLKDGSWDVDNGTGGEGIDIKDGSQHVLVQDNRVHNLYFRTGIYIDAWNKLTRDIQVIDNHVYNNSNAGISVASEKVKGKLNNIQIIDNYVHDNAFAGINIKGSFNNQNSNNQTGDNHPVINYIDIQWNTIENNGNGIDKNIKGLKGGEGGLSFGNAPSHHISIENNHFIGNYTDRNSNTVTNKNGETHTFPQINFQSGKGSGIITLENSVNIENNRWD